MQLVGQIVDVQADGCERTVLVELRGTGARMAFSVPVPTQYMTGQERCQTYLAGHDIDVEVKLVFVTKVSAESIDRQLSFFQPIAKSPHTVVFGVVSEIAAADEFICQINDEGGKINVSTEMAFQLHVGTRVSFRGELTHAG